jgi:hypothetical protein
MDVTAPLMRSLHEDNADRVANHIEYPPHRDPTWGPLAELYGRIVRFVKFGPT